MTTRIDCSEAGFSEFLLANPQLDGHADLIWQLHAVYWATSASATARRSECRSSTGTRT